MPAASSAQMPAASSAQMPAASSASRPGAAGSQEGPVACFGEIGLTGELRHVAHPERRLAEARKFGLGPVFGPAAGEGLEGLLGHASLVSALRAAFPSSKSARETGLAEPDQQAKAA